MHTMGGSNDTCCYGALPLLPTAARVLCSVHQAPSSEKGHTHVECQMLTSSDAPLQCSSLGGISYQSEGSSCALEPAKKPNFNIGGGLLVEVLPIEVNKLPVAVIRALLLSAARI